VREGEFWHLVNGGGRKDQLHLLGSIEGEIMRVRCPEWLGVKTLFL